MHYFYGNKKPNSFTNVKDFQKMSNLKEKTDSSVDSETNSHRDSNILVPKLSGSDLTSFVNDGHNCSVIEEDKKDEDVNENGKDMISSKGKPLVWYERLHSNEVKLKHRPFNSSNMLNVIKEDSKSK